MHRPQPTRNINYFIPQSRTQYYYNSFFPRTIRLWNALPVTIQYRPSVDIFTAQLPGIYPTRVTPICFNLCTAPIFSTQDEDKESKTQYVLDTTIHKQTQIT